MKRLFFVSGILGAIVACGRGGASSDVRLVNGSVAGLRQFPSVVTTDNCTGTKVGPRHFLLAAHCVLHPETMVPVVSRGGVFRYWAGVAARDRKGFSPTVEEVFVAPAFAAYAEANGHFPLGTFFEDGVISDVAVVVVREEPGTLPQAAVAFEAKPQAGDAITMVGTGCEKPYFDIVFSKRRLKFGATKITDAFRSSFWAEGGEPGAGNPPGGCAGDSGGPVFLGDGSTGKVIGVNSYLREGGTVFARLDAEVETGVARWLQGILRNSH